MKANEVLDRLVQLGKASWQRYRLVWLVILAGLVLLMLPLGGGEEEVLAESPVQSDFDLAGTEARLAEALSKIKGAGEVTVVLTVANGPRQVLAQDTQSRGEGERSVSTVTLGRGSGSQEVVPLQTVAPQFRGALVVCAGGDDPGVRLQVIRAVSALTGLGSDCITVCQGDP